MKFLPVLPVLETFFPRRLVPRRLVPAPHHHLHFSEQAVRSGLAGPKKSVTVGVGCLECAVEVEPVIELLALPHDSVEQAMIALQPEDQVGRECRHSAKEQHGILGTIDPELHAKDEQISKGDSRLTFHTPNVVGHEAVSKSPASVPGIFPECAPYAYIPSHPPGCRVPPETGQEGSTGIGWEDRVDGS
jgi:hypothetical protein